MPNHPLISDRLVLEPIVADHATPLFPLFQDRDLYPFIPQDPPISIDALRSRYERLSTRQSPDGREIWLNWAARRNDMSPNDMSPNGASKNDTPGPYLGYLQAGVDGNRQGMIAYFIFTPFQHQGYATEACRLVLTRLFDHFDCRAVDAWVDTRNQASIGLLERLGFTRLRRIPDADHFKGATSHEYHYSKRMLGGIA